MNLSSKRPLVYLITSGEATSANFSLSSREILDLIRAAVDERVDLIQIREKQLSARPLFELASAAAAITRDSVTHLLVNDRADIALAAKADGVHLTARSLSPKLIRQIFPADLIIGVSTHTIAEVVIAEQDGADFVVYGPVFEAPDKGPAVGLEGLSEACETVSPFPVLGLGGVVEDNYSTVIQAGASGFAAIRALNDVATLRSICRGLKK